jgi:hypothetical protein
MDDTLVFLGFTIMGALAYGVVFARLKVQSWLGAKRLAAIEDGNE